MTREKKRVVPFVTPSSTVAEMVLFLRYSFQDDEYKMVEDMLTTREKFLRDEVDKMSRERDMVENSMRAELEDLRKNYEMTLKKKCDLMEHKMRVDEQFRKSQRELEERDWKEKHEKLSRECEMLKLSCDGFEKTLKEELEKSRRNHEIMLKKDRDLLQRELGLAALEKLKVEEEFIERERELKDEVERLSKLCKTLQQERVTLENTQKAALQYSIAKYETMLKKGLDLMEQKLGFAELEKLKAKEDFREWERELKDLREDFKKLSRDNMMLRQERSALEDSLKAEQRKGCNLMEEKLALVASEKLKVEELRKRQRELENSKDELKKLSRGHEMLKQGYEVLEKKLKAELGNSRKKDGKILKQVSSLMEQKLALAALKQWKVWEELRKSQRELEVNKRESSLKDELERMKRDCQILQEESDTLKMSLKLELQTSRDLDEKMLKQEGILKEQKLAVAALEKWKVEEELRKNERELEAKKCVNDLKDKLDKMRRDCKMLQQERDMLDNSLEKSRKEYERKFNKYHNLMEQKLHLASVEKMKDEEELRKSQAELVEKTGILEEYKSHIAEGLDHMTDEIEFCKERWSRKIALVERHVIVKGSNHSTIRKNEGAKEVEKGVPVSSLANGGLGNGADAGLMLLGAHSLSGLPRSGICDSQQKGLESLQRKKKLGTYSSKSQSAGTTSCELACDNGLLARKRSTAAAQSSTKLIHQSGKSTCKLGSAATITDLSGSVDKACGASVVNIDAKGMSSGKSVSVETSFPTYEKKARHCSENHLKCIRKKRKRSRDKSEDFLDSRLKSFVPFNCSRKSDSIAPDASKANSPPKISSACVKQSVKISRREGSSQLSMAKSVGDVVDSANYSSAHSSDDSNFLSPVNKEVPGFQRTENYTWRRSPDMLSDFKQIPELCMSAVCALYRRRIFEDKSAKGVSVLKLGGCSTFRIVSGTEVAKYLINNNPENKLSRTVSEVQSYRPGLLADCQRLAMRYGEQLFEIYQKKLDPFFCPDL